jgi:hypothetical protein
LFTQRWYFYLKKSPWYFRVNNFSALALDGVKLRNYPKTQKPQPIKDLPLLDAA